MKKIIVGIGISYVVLIGCGASDDEKVESLTDKLIGSWSLVSGAGIIDVEGSAESFRIVFHSNGQMDIIARVVAKHEVKDYGRSDLRYDRVAIYASFDVTAKGEYAVAGAALSLIVEDIDYKMGEIDRIDHPRVDFRDGVDKVGYITEQIQQQILAEIKGKELYKIDRFTIEFVRDTLVLTDTNGGDMVFNESQS